METFRTTAIGMCILHLAACTSANIARHTPQEVRALPERSSETTVPVPHERARLDKLPVPIVPPPVVTGVKIAPPAPPVPSTAGAPQAPVPIISCDPGGCWDMNAGRYNNGGGASLDRSGRLCQSSGTWVQCF